MCKCTPNIRTPFCGRPGCEWPKQKEKTKENKRTFLILDKTSGNHVEITIDENREFLEVWPIDHNGEKQLIVQSRAHPFVKPPFIVHQTNR